MGLFLAGMAVLQAWPGRGFWQGTSHGQPGTLTGMIQSMAATPQPRFLSAWVSGFGSFDAAHGFAVNLFVVAALAVTGAVFLSGQPRLIRPALIAFTVLCLADWVLIEDLGFFGGLGTDPNSMIPMALLAVAGYLALTRAPSRGGSQPPPQPRPGWRDRIQRSASPPARSLGPRQHPVRGVGRRDRRDHPRRGPDGGRAGQPGRRHHPGAAPSTAPAPRSTTGRQRSASPTSTAGPSRWPACAGKWCCSPSSTRCARGTARSIAQEFRQAGQLLGADSRHVELVAIVANPVDYQLGYTRAFDRQERLAGVPNWLYLTGTLPRLRQVWRGLRHRRAGRAGRGDDRAQRCRLRHRPGRPRAAGNGLRPRPRHSEHQILVRRGADRRSAAAAEAIMSRPARRPAIALALAGRAVLAAGCGSAAAPAPVPAARPAPPAPSLDTSLVTAAGTWAVAVMGGSAAQHNNFWQLFARPAGSTRWTLVTPPGTADNGGLVLAGGGQSLITGLRPSQDLTYTPLAVTGDGGRAWSSAGPLDAALANVPDALAAAPRSGQLARPARRRHRALAAARLHQLEHPGQPQVPRLDPGRPALRAAEPHRRRVHPGWAAAAGRSCDHPDRQASSPPRAGSGRRRDPGCLPPWPASSITVLRLTRTASLTAALLAAGTGPAASLLAAWSADNGSHWALSLPFRLDGAQLTSASFGPGGTAAIVLNGKRGQAIAGPEPRGGHCPPCRPARPPWSPTAGGGLDALAVHRTQAGRLAPRRRLPRLGAQRRPSPSRSSSAHQADAASIITTGPAAADAASSRLLRRSG